MSIYVKYLVCYDISDTKIRKKFSDCLKDLGLVSLQESVFYGDLKKPEVSVLEKTVFNMIKKTDKCFWFPCSIPVETLKKCFGYDNFSYFEPDSHAVV